MMALNPYERRRRRDGDRWVGMDSAMTLWPATTPPRESPVAFEDLEALVANVRRRTQLHADAQCEQRVMLARREAWDEGYGVGVVAGRDTEREGLLSRIDGMCGHEVRTLHQAASAVLERVGSEPRRVSKAELERALDATVDMLARLVNAHHAGFEGEF